MPSSSICFFVLLFPCAYVGKTLLHEFPISYTHSEWKLLFSEREYAQTGLKLRLSEPNSSYAGSIDDDHFAVTIRECLGKHLRTSSSFHKTILNGTCFFRQCNYTCTIAYSGPNRRNADALVNLFHPLILGITTPGSR